eukprot:1154114-Pelagomonas_calceolata.AAC.4
MRPTGRASPVNALVSCRRSQRTGTPEHGSQRSAGLATTRGKANSYQCCILASKISKAIIALDVTMQQLLSGKGEQDLQLESTHFCTQAQSKYVHALFIQAPLYMPHPSLDGIFLPEVSAEVHGNQNPELWGSPEVRPQGTSSCTPAGLSHFWAAAAQAWEKHCELEQVGLC